MRHLQCRLRGWSNTNLLPFYMTTFLWANSRHRPSSNSIHAAHDHVESVSADQRRQDQHHHDRPLSRAARPACRIRVSCVFTFCDGHTQTISEDIDYRVYKQLMTPYGGNTGVSGTTIVGSGDIDSFNTVLSNNF